MNPIKIDISKIIPDKDQPRKSFDVTKLAQLRESIKKQGIVNPIIVEEIPGGKGTFIIVDGERRYRVAESLGLKVLPIVVIKPQNDIDRLVQQFHIQEQHEGWLPTEKAMVLHKLVKQLNIPMNKAYEMLGISGRTANSYASFAALQDKEGFQKSGAKLEWAGKITSLKKLARRVSAEQDVDFDGSTSRQLEKAVVNRIINGDIENSHDFTKLKDSFTMNPKLIRGFIDTDVTPEVMFVKTKAKGAYYLRNLLLNCGYLETNCNAFLKEGTVKVNEDDVVFIKRTYKTLSELLRKIG